jgi:hypothetical protein
MRRRRWAVVASLVLVVIGAVPAAMAGTASSDTQLGTERRRAVDSIAWSGFLASGSPGMSVGIWVRDKDTCARSASTTSIRRRR